MSFSGGPGPVPPTRPVELIVESAGALAALGAASAGVAFARIANTDRGYYWDPDSAASSDGVYVIAASGVATGRWLLGLNSGVYAILSEENTFDEPLTIPDGVSSDQAASVGQVAAGAVPALEVSTVAATANVTVAAPGATFDGVTLSNSGVDTVFLAYQSSAAQNGRYVWNGAASPLTRATGATTAAQLGYVRASIATGDTLAGATFQCQKSAATITSDGGVGTATLPFVAVYVPDGFADAILAAESLMGSVAEWLTYATPSTYTPVIACKATSLEWIIRIFDVYDGGLNSFTEFRMTNTGATNPTNTKAGGDPDNVPLPLLFQVTGRWAVVRGTRRKMYDANDESAPSTVEPVSFMGAVGDTFPTDFDFGGPGHGNMGYLTDGDIEVRLDGGSNLNLAPVGTRIGGDAFTFEQEVELLQPSDSAIVLFTIVYSHVFNSSGLQLTGTRTKVLTDGQEQNSYAVLDPTTGCDRSQFTGGGAFDVGERPVGLVQVNSSADVTASISDGAGGAGTILVITVLEAGGLVKVGDPVTGSGVAVGTVITADAGGGGGIGNYTVNNSQLRTSQAMVVGVTEPIGWSFWSTDDDSFYFNVEMLQSGSPSNQGWGPCTTTTAFDYDGPTNAKSYANACSGVAAISAFGTLITQTQYTTRVGTPP
jgi:hypothetical protein